MVELVLFAGLGILVGILDLLYLYGKYRKSGISMARKIEDAEIELLEDIEYVGAEELQQTQSGQALLEACAGLYSNTQSYGPDGLRGLSSLGELVKLGMDYSMALFAIVFLSPVYVAIALAIKLDSRGPIFYRRKAVGRNGTVFDMLVFRTSYIDDDLGQIRPPEASRITRVGQFLRRTSLDMLPLYFNVLRGQMSLVGPWVISPIEINGHGPLNFILTVKPGITGPVQVSGLLRMPYEGRIRLETYYIRQWSVWLDLSILFKTTYAVINSEFGVTEVEKPKDFISHCIAQTAA